MKALLKLLLAVTLLTVPQLAGAAITCTTGGSANEADNNTTIETGSFAVGGSGVILVVAVMSGAGTPVDPSAVKWGGSGGTPLTQIATTVNVGSFGKLSLWRLLNPTATTSTVHVTWGSNQDEQAVGAVYCTGVDVGGTPLGTPNSATGTNANSSSVTISSAAGEVVIDAAMFLDQSGNLSSLTPHVSQTAHHAIASVGGADFEAFGMSEEAGAATVAMDWTAGVTAGVVEDWGAIGVSLKPAAVGGGNTPSGRLTLMGVGD